MPKIALIGGNGKFGQKYLSTLQSQFQITPQIGTRDNWKQLIDQKPDGVIICTPPDSHIEIALFALKKGLPVMIEKPLALSLSETEQLKSYQYLPILVNHIHIFSSKYQEIKDSIALRQITHIKSIGSSNSPPRNYSRLWDYAPHDIAMILDLTQTYPKQIMCQTDDHQSFQIKMQFDSFESVSQVGYSETRIRHLDINNGRFIYDGMQNEFPLTNAIGVFLRAIKGKPDYRLGLDLSLKVMQVLEACQKYLDKK